MGGIKLNNHEPLEVILNNQRMLIIGSILVILILVLGGFLLYDWVLGETEAASGPIAATPVLTQAAGLPETAPTDPPAAPPTEPPAAAPTQIQPEPQIVTTEPPAAEPAQPVALQVYNLDQAGSEARFIIYEELRGQPVNVVGRTDQVAGQIALDPSDLSAAQIGPVQINARTLVTDSEQRNRAIRNRILNTDSYEFITFTPAQISGLNGPVVPGAPLTFQIAGDLTIRDITQPVVFEVTAQMDADGRITGTAVAAVQRGDYNLVIPSVPGVANVGEEVTLEIDFVAVAGA